MMMVSAVGIEPTRITPADFKSAAFTYFATPTIKLFNPVDCARDAVMQRFRIGKGCGLHHAPHFDGNGNCDRPVRTANHFHLSQVGRVS